MSRLEKLYEATILDHNRSPRNFGALNPHTHSSHGVNPLCGDDYFVFIRLNTENTIDAVTFEGSGCAISKSSGSLMTEALHGLTLDEALNLKNKFIKLVTSDVSDDELKQLGKLKVFQNVKKFPIRVKCAALVWRAIEDALETRQGEITTEQS